MVWEECIIMMPKQARFVFLSATIPNAREFADWIAKIHRCAFSHERRSESLFPERSFSEKHCHLRRAMPLCVALNLNVWESEM